MFERESFQYISKTIKIIKIAKNQAVGMLYEWERTIELQRVSEMKKGTEQWNL